MADSLIFPIKFDLEKAVIQAQGDADRFLRRLQTTINSKPLAVNLKIVNAGGGSINEINARMGELVKQWNVLSEAQRIGNKTTGEFTPEAKKILAEYTRLIGATESYARTLGQIASEARRSANEQERAMARVSKQRAKALGDAKRTLSATENSVANVTAKLQLWQKVLNSSDIGEKKFRRASDEVNRLTERLDVLKTKINEATGKTQQQGAATRQLSQEFQKQDSYLKNLLKKTAALWSLNQVTSFLTNIRQVTAEFELQRVSLGAIIQDQTRANQLFGEIKAFALKSPLKILDLTKYTKQVAAYGFETEKLFDTTKRLADISVGLGVDMSRLALFMGQVRARGALYSSELRQATEAGIPLVELLAEKYSLLEQRTVSAAEVQERIEKRMVSFSMVEEIFNDMTDAGGMFYNMQEKQSQTLYGMWAKMGDAAAVMYEQIGNTATVNSGMKALIQLLQDMMLHWTAIASVIQTSVIGFAAYKAAMAGLIPFYKLQTKLTKNQMLAEKARAASQIQMMAVGRQLTAQEKFSVKTKSAMMAADWKLLLMEGKLSAAQQLTVARMAASNNQIRRAVLETKLFTQAQITALGKMSAWQFFWAKFKLQLANVGQAFVNLGRQMLAFAPLAAITAVISLIQDWGASVAAQNEAVKKVDKQYDEMRVTLMEIENAYRDIQNASKAAGESEEEFAKSSFKQKLEQLEKVIKLLGQFGMQNVIDPSVLDYTNIDPVLDKWLAKLNEANELSRDWGREVALVANAYEGNVMGWSIFGENLKEDMKDLERAWTKLTVNTEFNDALAKMRAEIGSLANTNKDVYNTISKAIGMDAKLALSQKRRNESELQYQQRIYKNFVAIGQEMGHSLFGTDWAAMANIFEGTVLKDFQSQVDEVMHEFDKVKEKFRDKDALTVKMAIDTVAAENDWTEWQKELLIQHLNEDPITLNAEIIPTDNVAGQDAVAEGMKAIITSEFPTLFNEDELKSLVSIDGIYEAIKAKLDASNESIEKTVRLQNNLAYGSKGYENSLNRIKQLQAEITEVENMRAELSALEGKNGDLTFDELSRKYELEVKLAEVDEESINAKRAQIAAIVEANAKTDEQIKKQRESAEAEREIAKAALDRISSMGLSSIGEDVKQQFGGLMVDAVKEMTDKNYSTDFLISDEELKKVRDVGDLYALWAQNTKAITEEKKKLAGVGITEATIEKERAALEEKRAKIQLQLSAVEAEISNEKYAGLTAQYEQLKVEFAQTTDQTKRVVLQNKINDLLGDTKNAEFAILMMKKEGLKTTLQETLVSEAANNQVNNYLKGLDDAEKLWKELGKRYNFQLQESGRGRTSKSDPRLQILNEMVQLAEKLNKEYSDWEKKVGSTKALEKVNATYEKTVKYAEQVAKNAGISLPHLKTPTNAKELNEYLEAVRKVMETAKGLKGGKKAAIELAVKMSNNVSAEDQKAIEEKIKALADRISRTKTAKEFYEKILGMTGDVELAANVSLQIYGSTGKELSEQIKEQFRLAFATLDKPDAKVSAKIGDLIDKGRFEELRDYIELLPESQRKAAEDLVKAQQQMSVKQYEQWLKDLEKAKDYADKRIELSRYTANQIAAIEERIAKLNPLAADYEQQKAMLEKLIAGYKSREVKMGAELDYEQFKNSALYVQVFENLDNASKTALENMRNRLLALKDQWKGLSPEKVKELTKRLEELDAQIAQRNPFKSIADSIKKLREMRMSGRTKEGDAKKAFDAEEDRKVAEAKMLLDEKAYEAAVKQYGAESNIAKEKRKIADESAEAYRNSEKAADRAAENADEWKNVEEAISSANQKIDKYQEQINEALDGVRKMMEAFGASDEDMQFFDDVVGSLNDIVDAGQQAVTATANIMSGNPAQMFQGITQGVSAIGGIVSGFSNLFSAGKVKKANKEIKRQQQILEQLEYTYSRLEAKTDKLFGRDYINNFKKQQENLEAQARAYKAQADAERSKGKKADEGKIKEYENAYRETMDKIADMQGKLAERMTGSDIASSARDFANAWLEAYASFGNTAGAIKDKFKDMIKNMVIESVLAQTVQRSLQPMFDKIDEMYKQGASMTSVLAYAFEESNRRAEEINNALTVAAHRAEQAGVKLRGLTGSSSDFSGISRDIASASEESINGLAAGVNTQNYYMSYTPRIYDEVAALRAMLEKSYLGSAMSYSGGIDYTDIINISNQHLSSLPSIEANTAQTVKELQEVIGILRRVTIPKGGSAAYGVNVYMRN